MEDYEDFIGILTKVKHRAFNNSTVLLVFTNEHISVTVEFGKLSSASLKAGDLYTIGHIGKRLINIRAGMQNEMD